MGPVARLVVRLMGRRMMGLRKRGSGRVMTVRVGVGYARRHGSIPIRRRQRWHMRFGRSHSAAATAIQQSSALSLARCAHFASSAQLSSAR